MAGPAPRRHFLLLLLGAAVGGLTSLPAAGADKAAPRLHRVAIKRFVFHPQELEIRPGDSVVWINQDPAPHTASADDGSWDSGELAKKATYQVRFDSPGSIAYHCAFHPHMRGRITIIDA